MRRLIASAILLAGLSASAAVTAQTESDPAAAANQAPVTNPMQMYPWMPAPMPYGAVNPYGAAMPYGGVPNWQQLMNMQWWMQNSAQMMNAPIDEMTRFSMLDAMMRAANMQMFESMFGGPNQAKMMIPSQNKYDVPPNTVSGAISDEAKRNMYQSLMMLSPLSLRDMISIMADKMPVAEDVSFEDAVDSMKLRANEINFKFVGHSPLWLDVKAITGDEDTPRIEIFQFCDAVVARKILDYAPEFVVFLPCRIALIEDADRKLWVMTLDWDVNWLNLAQNPNSVLDEELKNDAIRIRDGMRYIMEGAATGDF